MTATAVLDAASELAFLPDGSPPQRWCIVTCEYPPLAGGVSDHTFQLAGALAAAGDSVDVWCPPAPGVAPATPGVTVRVLPSHFGLDALGVLRDALRALPDDTRVLVQYVPTAFGWRMLNVPFALLLFSLRRRGFELYVHEVAMPVRRGQSMRRNLAGAIHGAMAWLATRGARRIYVTIPEWRRRLAQLGAGAVAGRREVTCVPIPSNVPDRPNTARVTAIRRALLVGNRRSVVGHFGTFGRFHTAVLGPTTERILDGNAGTTVLLVGRNGATLRDALAARRPELASRIVATGELSADEVSAHLAACDVLLQPYDDGVSERRSSLTAGMALGMPIVGNRGVATSEPWTIGRSLSITESAEPAVLASAVATLLADPERRRTLGASARALYLKHFALDHAVALLRGTVRVPAPRTRAC